METGADLPLLAELLRWLSEMPAAFDQPAGFGGRTPAEAVGFDLLETLYSEPPADLVRFFRRSGSGPRERRRLCWLLAAAYLLWHPAFRGRPLPPEGLRDLFGRDLPALAEVEGTDRLRDDEERREELIRRTLRALGLRLPGESAADAEDRLAQVDSVERRRLLREAAENERRAQELRRLREEQERRAREAAARYSPE
jgi:hypothetical protein